MKVQTRTYVEFARDKETFDKWCAASKAHTLSEVRELLLLEDFKNHLPDRIGVHLNEKKVESLSQAAVLADEYTLTHKTMFSAAPASRYEGKPTTPTRGTRPLPSEAGQRPEQKECYYCHKVGYMIADCPTLRSKPKSPQRQSKEVGLVLSVERSCKPTSVPDPSYSPFVSKGWVSLAAGVADTRAVNVLRDTGVAQSLILASVLPWSDSTSVGSQVLLHGLGKGLTSAPLHWVNLKTDLVSGCFHVGVVPEFPVSGVALLLGNDIVGGKVIPVLEVIDGPPTGAEGDGLSSAFPHVFPACVVTRAQARKLGEVVDLADCVRAH